MAETDRKSGAARRWELSEEERARIERVYERPLTSRRLARLFVRNPRLAAEVLRAIGQGAIDSIGTGSSVMWAIDAERVREAVPDAASGASWSGESSFLEPVTRLITPGMRALDLGCGAGRFAHHVAPLVRELVCVDSSRVLLDESRAQLREHRNVTFLRNQGWSIPGIMDSSVDFVFSQGLFGFIGPREFAALAAECRRVLRPGGAFLFSAYIFEADNPTGRVPTSLRRQIERGRVHSGIPEPYTREYLSSLLALAEFEVPDSKDTIVDADNGYAIFSTRRPSSS